MRAQYFWNITEEGVEAARQMVFLVEKGHDAVFSSSYPSTREAITSKLEGEAEKQLAKERLDKARGGSSRGEKTGAEGARE